MYNKVCTVCGKEFTSAHRRSTLCSDECRKISQKASLYKYLGKKTSESRARVAARTCVICGNLIDPATKRVKYCCEECAAMGFQIKHDKANQKKLEELKARKNEERKAPKPKKITLDKTLKALNKYNAKHGTKLDYGQYARMMGL